MAQLEFFDVSDEKIRREREGIINAIKHGKRIVGILGAGASASAGSKPIRIRIMCSPDNHSSNIPGSTFNVQEVRRA
jgi:hypothetical protein